MDLIATRKEIVKILGQMYADGVMEVHPSTAKNADRILAVLPHWISVTERLPEIPEGQFGVSVMAIEYDPIYAEVSGGDGRSVTNLCYDKEGFKSHYVGGKEGNGWMEPGDEVTHWMYRDSLLDILPPKED